MPIRYEQDVAAWADEQARLIRSGRFDALDVERVADEIEDVGRSEKRELTSRMAVLMARLLKWQHQPVRRPSGWLRTIHEQRKQIRLKIKDTPSLKPLLADQDWSSNAWSEAVTEAIGETGLDTFPAECPWAVASVLEEGWLPDDLTGLP